MHSSPIRVIDSTLRDGSHAVQHQFTAQQVADVAVALAHAHVPVIEVSHGDGLGGSSLQYGRSVCDDLDLIATAVDALEQVAEKIESRTSVAVLLLPGIGTCRDLRTAHERGARVARIATHCSEADIAIQHIGMARQLGMETIGFLMLSHMLQPSDLAKQATIMAGAGAQCVYVVDSAGALTPDQTVARVDAIRNATDVAVGIHAHNNLSLAVANSVAAIRAGAEYVDGCLAGLGAGAGNTQLEVLAAVLDRVGVTTGLQLEPLMAAADEVAVPLMQRPQVIDRASLALGYAGVYSSFLLHAELAAKRYTVPIETIIMELGRRGVVGGQEDMIIDVARGLAAGL